MEVSFPCLSTQEVVAMDLSLPTIEDLTSKQLRRLGLGRHKEQEEDEEDDIYAEEVLLDLEDNDEISPAEGGFMMGYLEALE
ncbi:hypothetical protein HYS50_01625 [Candidatus Woesearchaeota archaeon]|nr:hypothetical protein [Candidatus Woesearchaeota archaeon]